jgi:cobalt/nickel transport protein
MNATSPPKRHNSKRPLVKNVLLSLLAIALAIVPLFIARNAEFGGADAQAEKAITEIKPEYTPWFSPLWKPPGREIESFLFAMQAAIGAGFIGYYFGYARGRKRRAEEDES